MDIQNLNAIDRAVEREFEDIVQTARAVSEMFWDHRKNMLEVRSKGVTPLLGCRVDIRDKSVRISWFYWEFYKVKGQVRRSNVHIPRSKSSHAYAMSKLLAKALPNEVEMVEYCEQEFTKLRARGESLKKLKQAFYYHKRNTLGNDLEAYELSRKSKEPTQENNDDDSVRGFGESA